MAGAQAAGLGIIIDLVPNHLAASLENPWWVSLLTDGRAGPYGHYFDVNWQSSSGTQDARIVLPVLGKPIAEAIAVGDLRLITDAQGKCTGLSVHDQAFPCAPGALGLTSLTEVLAAPALPAGVVALRS